MSDLAQQQAPATDLPLVDQAVDPNTPMNPQPTNEQKGRAITIHYGGPVPPEPDLDGNQLQRIQEANKFHSPVEAKIRDYQAKAQTVVNSQKATAGEALPGAPADTSGAAQPTPASPEPVKNQEITEGETTYTVEQKPQGFFVTQTTDKDGNVTPYEDGIFVGKQAPKGTEQGFMDQLKNLSAQDVANGAKDAAVGTGNAVKGAFVGADVGAIKLATNAVRTLVDNPIGKYYVGKDNVEAFNTFTDWLGGELDKARETINQNTTAGKVGSFVGEAGTNFVAPGMAAYRKLRVLGASPLLAAALGDVGVSVFGVNPDQANLSSNLPNDGALKPLRDLMATDPKDPSWENRARNATEALATLGVAEAGAKTIVGVVSHVNQFAKDHQLPKQFMDALDRYVQDETGSLKLGGTKAPSPELPSGPQRSEVMDKAIASLGPVVPGQPAIADQVVAEMRAAAQGTGATTATDFNIARMQNGSEIGDLIDKVSEVYKEPIYKAKRGTQTFSETQEKADLAREMGFDVEEIVNRPDGKVWNAEQLKAARDIFLGEVDKTKALAMAIKAPGGDSQEALVAFRRQLAVVAAVQMQIKGAQTEAARALSQFRMMAKSPLEASVNVREMLDQAGGHDVNAKMVDAFLNLARTSNDASSLARFARNAQEVTTPDLLYEAWINSLLGSPKTHIVNISGNAIAAGQGVVERFGAAAYGAGERTFLRMVGKNPTPGGIDMTEAVAYSRGMAFGVMDALRMAGKALKSGESQDMFSKLSYGDKITAQNINQLPISKSISGRLGRDELLKTNSTAALFVDRLGEFYYRLPGRFLMAEDEFFKTLTYRAEVNAQAAREAMSLNFTPEQAAARRAEIMADPQVAAPSIHLASIDNAREFTFTQPAGEFAGAFQKTLGNAKLGDVPVGRVVIPFFNVINNITKFVGSRLPGVAILNPRSQTYKDLFSGDPAKRQLVMGKWATGGALAGWAAWMNQNGQMTGRLTDNVNLRKQMQNEGKMPYAVRVPMPDGSYKMLQYNRLDPVGMLMGIAATTSEVMNYTDKDDDQQSLVIAATSAILPYLEDKSFFKGAAQFANALFPQYGDDTGRAKALSDYFIGLGASAPGALLGPLAPGTPLSRWGRTEIAGDRTIRASAPNPYKMAKDQWGDDVLIPSDEFAYRTWEGVIKKVMDATPGLSSRLPPSPNLWGEARSTDNGVFSSSPFSPISSSTLKYDVGKLNKTNLPDQVKNGYFNGVQIGRDITLDQFKTFVNVVGIDGELERLGAPVAMPSKQIAAKNGAQNVGLPVKMNDDQYAKYMKILNALSVPNDADDQRRSMTMREFMDWTVKQPEYAQLPEDGNARMAKGDILNQVVRKYRIAADNIFLDTEDGKLLRKRSIMLQLKAQNTGAQQ